MRLFFTTDWYTKSLDLAQAPLAFPLDSTFLLNLAYTYELSRTQKFHAEIPKTPGWKLPEAASMH
jgi:hypothetical protein